MGSPVCRIGDTVTGICEASGSDHPRDFVGIWSTGSDVATADGIPIVRVGDVGHTDCGHTFMAVEGSDITDENGIPVHRVGDVVHVIEGGVGVSATGSDTVTSE